MAVSLSGITTIMPVLSFLLVFILMYALIVKTKVLGENKAVSLFLSLIIASFFIVNVQIVDFVNINVSWFVVFFVCVLLVMLIVAFMGKESFELITKGAWSKPILGVILVAFIILFAVSSSYVFNWAINWNMIQGWFDQSWFGMVLLIVVAGIVSWALTKN